MHSMMPGGLSPTSHPVQALGQDSLGAASQAGLSQQGSFGQPPQHQHQGPQAEPGPFPSLLPQWGRPARAHPHQNALHSLGSLSTPALSTSTPADSHSHSNFQHDHSSQYSMLPKVDQLQMQFGQVQLNGNDFTSGFGTGFRPLQQSEPVSGHQQSSSGAGHVFPAQPALADSRHSSRSSSSRAAAAAPAVGQ